MMRLRLFGPAELVTGGGEELRQVLSQPKRLGLLIYLAIAEPAGFQRRDTLLALFWPELDTESARRALRQSLHFLRSHLGADALQGRGAEEVRLAPGALWCDVVAYREALAAGRLADALELRRGELLPGFHVKEASPEFDEWLSGERAQLRQSAALAARTLAAAEEGEGRLARALLAAQRALELAPTDEGSARTVMRLSHALDDGDGALQVYEALRERLREYDAEPEGDTRALAAAIRREMGSRPAPRSGALSLAPAAMRATPTQVAATPTDPVSAADTPADAAIGGVAPAAAASAAATPLTFAPGAAAPSDHGPRVILPGDRGHRMVPRWAGRSLAAALAVGAVVLLLGAINVGPAATLFADAPPATRALVVLTDFTAPDGDASLARVVSHAVRDGLAQSSALEVMPMSRVASTLELMRRPRETRVDLSTAREVALREGGSAVVDGEVARAGDDYVVTVRLVSADSDRVLASEQRAGKGGRGLIEAADELALALRRRAGESLQQVQASVPLRRARTESLEAARRYTEGAIANEMLVDWPRAAEKFREAVAIDSTFAMAWLYLGVVYANAGAPRSQVEGAMLRAYELRDRLPPMERLAVEGAYFGSGPGRDRAKAMEIVRRMPQAWNVLALQYQRRRELARAESTWRAGLAADSGNRLMLRNLALNLRLQGKLDAADSVGAVLLRRFGTDASVPFARTLDVLLRGSVEEAERLFDERARRPNAGPSDISTRRDIALLRGQREVWRAFAAPRAGGGAGPGGALRRAVELATLAALEARVFGDASSTLAEVERVLERRPFAAVPEVDRPYLPVAAALAWAGRPARARALLQEYATAVRDTSLKRSQLPELRTAEGAIAFAERRYREAIALFRQGDSLPDGPAHLFAARLPLFLALSFDAANAPDSAIAEYERYLSMPAMLRWEAPLDPASLAQVHERLGQLHEGRGDVEKAAANYRAFVRLWERADPALQPRVTTARARWARLE